MSARATRGRVGRVAAAGLGLALLPAALAAQEIRYSGSLSYAQGEYIFTERTETVALLNGLALRWDRFGARVSLPVLMQNSSAVSYVHGVYVPTGGPDGRAVRQRQPGQTIRMGPRGGNGGGSMLASHGASADAGVADTMVAEPGDFEVQLGDPVLSASLEAYRGYGPLRSLEVEASAKAPLASVESGVGTGEWDYGVGGSLALGAGQALLFADATYWALGDMPELELRDYLDYGVGLGRPFGEHWSAVASLAAATEIIDNVDPPVSLSLSVSRRGAVGRSVNAGVSVGLSESAADLAVFVGWGMDILGRR